MEDLGDLVRLVARTRTSPVTCPECGEPAIRVHDRYWRRLQDLSCCGRPVQVVLQVRRFICDTPACVVATFAEQVDGLTARHQRRTIGLRSLLERVALALAGRAGSRLARVLGAIVSRCTLIRLIRALPDPADRPGRGARRGRLGFQAARPVLRQRPAGNMDTARLIDILPDREAGTFAAWLRAHPGVRADLPGPGRRLRAGRPRRRARARARSPTGGTCGITWATRQEDRRRPPWCIQDHYAALEQAAAQQAPDPSSAPGRRPPPTPRTGPGWCGPAQRYEQVQALKAEGKNIAAIMRELRLAPGTARRYYHAASVDELVAGTLAGWPSKLDDYKPYLHQRWNAGCTNIRPAAPGDHRAGLPRQLRHRLRLPAALQGPGRAARRPGAAQGPPHHQLDPAADPANLDDDEQAQPQRSAGRLPAPGRPAPATSRSSPRSSPAGTASASTPGSPPSAPTTCPTCTPSPTGSNATTPPSSTG